MKQRILVAVVGIPLLLFVLCWAPAWATMVLLAALSVIASHEFMTAVCGKERAKKRWSLAGIMSLYMIWFSGAAEILDAPKMAQGLPVLAALLIVAVFAEMVVEYGKENALTFTDAAAIFASGIAIPLALSSLLHLRTMPDGGGMVLIPLVAAFCSDSMALFAGMLFGKHKLAPMVSPKKTVEGAIGGLVGGMVGMVLFRIIFACCTGRQLDLAWCLVIGLFGAAMGQLGDLSFSVIKREYGIKDYGRLLPGHGGVLDRFDSVIFAAPVIWLILKSVTL